MSPPIRALIPLSGLALGSLLGHVQLSGLLCSLAFIFLVLAPLRLPQSAWAALVVLCSILFAAHLLPGFQPWVVTPAQPLSVDAAPYSLRLSWDKLLVGLTLLAWWLNRPAAPAGHPRLVTPVFIATLLVVPGLAILLGLVAWQPKWPAILLHWLLINLGVSVLAEELLFRGVLQTYLTRWLGCWSAIVLTALLFGAAHAPFSPLFAVVAGVAGLGYGLVFHYSGRLSLAIALHGLVNLLHLLLLSYPLRLSAL